MKATFILTFLFVSVLLAGCGDANHSSDSKTSDSTVASDTLSSEDAENTDSIDISEEDTAQPACPEPTGQYPRARAEHAGIFDPQKKRLVIYGGSLGIPINCGFPEHTYENETWMYDTECEQWSLLDSSPDHGRTRHNAVYDSRDHRMIIFGGRSREGSSGPYTLYDSIWALDLNNDSWSQITPTNSGPAARINFAMAYDSTRHRILVFGGNTSNSGLTILEQNDTWAFDLDTQTWSELTITGTLPEKRLWVSGLYDAPRDQFLIFGGGDSSAFNSNATYFNKLWALEFSSDTLQWQQIDAESSEMPDRRFWSAMAYDSIYDSILLFGGHDDGNLGNRNDLWRFETATRQWVTVHIGDTFNKPANGVCDFPPDFTNVDMQSPERRHAHVFVTGENGAWLTGGKTDCGNVDDVFAFDTTSDTWQRYHTPSVGEVCIRRGGLQCNDLCF